MFKIPTVERFSQKLVQKCKIARIPLSSPECSFNSSAINKNIIKWKQLHQQNLVYQQKIADRKRSKSKTKYHFTMNPLPDYSTKITASTPAKLPPVKTDNLTRNLEYLTTEQYKRISPEFYKMLQRFNNQGVENLKSRRKKTITKIDPAHQLVELQQTAPDWARFNPNLYKYLQDVMNSENASNMIYGIDYQDNFDPEELDIIKMFADQRIARDMTRALNLFKILQSGGTLTPEQLQFLTEFLRKFAYLGAEKFGQFMDLLNAAGIEINSIRAYMRNLYEEIKSSLGPDQLRMVMSKLIAVDDENNSQFQKYGGNKRNISKYLNYGGNPNINSPFRKYGANFLRYQYNGADANKNAIYGADANNISPDANYDADANSVPWWESPPRRSTDESLKRDSNSSDLIYDQNLSNTDLSKRRRLSPNRVKFSKQKKLSSASDTERRSSSYFAEKGYYPPWNITPNWADKQKFFRLSTATRRSFM